MTTPDSDAATPEELARMLGPRDAQAARLKIGVIGPSTNTIVQPDFDAMRPAGVTNHYSRIIVENATAVSNASFTEGTQKIAVNVLDAVRSVNLTIGTSFFGVARSGLLYEPVLYWPDARLESHERRTTTDLPRHPANPEATELVKQITAEMLALYRQHSATHLQIGRMYPWAKDRNPPAMALIRAIKAELDPQNLINPGVLGL